MDLGELELLLQGTLPLEQLANGTQPIMSASLRDDEAERMRLVQSAPRSTYTVADYSGLSHANEEVTAWQTMTLLAQAAEYFEAMRVALLADSKADPENELLEWGLWNGYLFRTHLDGWRAFCADLHLDPDVMMKLLPGFAVIQRADKATQPGGFGAFTPEGGNRVHRRRLREAAKQVIPADAPESVAAEFLATHVENAMPLTVDGVRKALRTFLNERARWWGVADAN